MDWIVWIAVLFIIGSAVSNVRTKNQIGRMLGAKPAEQQPKAIAAPKKTEGHMLVRTWIVSTKDGSINAGWRWKCSCGVWGVTSDTQSVYNAKDRTTKYSIGSEKQAIVGFKEHALQYREANKDAFKDLYDKEQADFAEYRKLCYCKETNHDLIKWKGI